ncbi:MAG: VOC family protein [Halobacteriota archaeon]|nr:VOC family protein [Halobacteriota archaeon]
MPTIVHFDLPADDLERAQEFYSKLFGWKFQKIPGPMQFYLIETDDLEGNMGVGGGMGKREEPDQNIMNYFGVSSVDEYVEEVKKLGGKIVMGRTEVPGWGYLAICIDTEGNKFGLWQEKMDGE